MKRVILYVIFFACMFSAQTFAQSPETSDNDIRYACEASREISPIEASDNYCRVINDYLLQLLTPSDWQKYTQDYFKLAYDAKKVGDAYSYQRYLSMYGDHYRNCLKNNFKGCLKEDPGNPTTYAYHIKTNLLTDGDFKALKRDTLFKRYFIDYVTGYSAYCGNLMTNYIEETVTSQEWERVDHVWYKGNTFVRKTRIHPSLIEYYKQYSKADENAVLANMLVAVLKPYFTGEISFKEIGKLIGQEVDSIEFMREHFSQGCTSSNVKRTYANLINYTTGKTPQRSADFAALKQQEANAIAARKQQIKAWTKISYDRMVVQYQKEQAILTALPKPSFQCGKRQQNAYQNGIVMPDTQKINAMFPGVSGAWRGKINDTDVEIALYTNGRRQNAVKGYAYFPEYDCFMDGGMSAPSPSKIRGFPQYVGSAKFAFGQHRNMKLMPQNCKMLEVDKEEINAQTPAYKLARYRLNGFVGDLSPNSSFTLSPSNGFLGMAAPQGECDDMKVKFTPAPASLKFQQLMRRADQSSVDRYHISPPQSFWADIAR